MSGTCSECGAGPFKRLASHKRYAHGIASAANRERMAERRRRAGIAPRNFWTSEQDALILHRADLSYAAIAAMTGHTEESVSGRVAFLRMQGHQVPQRNPSNQKPTHRQGRTLVAQTCSGCGLLLDAEWFNLRGDTDGHATHKSVCRSCGSERGAIGARGTYRDLQRQSLTWVVEPGREYTDADMRVLMREDIDCLEMARLLGRSYASVLGTRQRLGLGDPKPRLGEPVETWIIDYREKVPR